MLRNRDTEFIIPEDTWYVPIHIFSEPRLLVSEIRYIRVSVKSLPVNWVNPSHS